MDNPDFLLGLKNFVDGWCENENRIRNANLGRRGAENSIVCLTRKISELEPRLTSRPSTIKEINTLKHQIRELEIKLAFDPYLNPEITNVH